MAISSLLELLFDENNGAGFGKIAGNNICVFAQDISVKSGAVNAQTAAKMKKIYANAVKFGAPLVTIFDSKGGEITEGIELAAAYSDIIENCSRLKGVVPLVSVVLGQCTGLNAALCRMSDFVLAVESSQMCFTPPFLGGNCEKEAADIIVKTAEEAVLKARELLSILPPNNLETPSCCGNFEIDARIKFGEIKGCTVGFVTLNGRLNAADTERIARFVSFCDSFTLPVVTEIDCEGFEADIDSRGTARLAQVYGGATTPKITLITGKAVGAVFILTGNLSDFVIAYEDAVISPVPVETGAVFLGMSEADYIKEYASVGSALDKGYIDMVIKPEEAADALAAALSAVRNKRAASVPRKRGAYEKV
jgi:acetyl-CoA carboxylase carboxyltransferase component